MKIVEQYLQAISRKLPLRGRADVKRELESLLMDEIETRCGSNADESEIKKILKSFGSPSEVARRYSGSKPVIAEGLAVLYFFIIKVVLGALAVAFFTIAVLSFIKGEHGFNAIMSLAAKFFGNVFVSSLSATGAVTLLFIAASRLLPNPAVNLDEDWNPDELESIEVDDGLPSKTESIITIFGLTVVIVLLNVFPEIVTLAEDTLMSSGLAVGLTHRVDISAFRIFVLVFTPIWAIELAYTALRLLGKKIPAWTNAVPLAIDVATLALHVIMVFDMALYTAYAGIVGFRLLFIIVASIEAVELMAKLGRMVMDRVGSMLK